MQRQADQRRMPAARMMIVRMVMFVAGVVVRIVMGMVVVLIGRGVVVMEVEHSLNKEHGEKAGEHPPDARVDVLELEKRVR